MLYSNHSCDANMAMRGEITFVAMRDIAAGEEFTHDWCTTDDDDYSVKCNCRSSNCRGKIDRQRLAASGIAKALRRIFLGLSGREDRADEEITIGHFNPALSLSPALAVASKSKRKSKIKVVARSERN